MSWSKLHSPGELSVKQLPPDPQCINAMHSMWLGCIEKLAGTSLPWRLHACIVLVDAVVYSSACAGLHVQCTLCTALVLYACALCLCRAKNALTCAQAQLAVCIPAKVGKKWPGVHSHRSVHLGWEVPLIASKQAQNTHFLTWVAMDCALYSVYSTIFHWQSASRTILHGVKCFLACSSVQFWT